VNVLAKLDSFVTSRCPICRCRYGSRSRRDVEDRILSLLFIYPYECRSCNHRFRALHFSLN
jgi:hypothetical protein